MLCIAEQSLIYLWASFTVQPLGHIEVMKYYLIRKGERTKSFFVAGGAWESPHFEGQSSVDFDSSSLNPLGLALFSCKL